MISVESLTLGPDNGWRLTCHHYAVDILQEVVQIALEGHLLVVCHYIHISLFLPLILPRPYHEPEEVYPNLDSRSQLLCRFWLDVGREKLVHRAHQMRKGSG